METEWKLLLGFRENGKNGNYCSILELYWDNGNRMETTIVYWSYIGIMEIEWKLLYSILGL